MKTPETDLPDTALAAKRGLSAVRRAWPTERYSPEDFESRLGDLLADLMHAAHTVGPDVFSEALDMARIHFEEEQADAAPPQPQDPRGDIWTF